MKNIFQLQTIAMFDYRQVYQYFSVGTIRGKIVMEKRGSDMRESGRKESEEKKRENDEKFSVEIIFHSTYCNGRNNFEGKYSYFKC